MTDRSVAVQLWTDALKAPTEDAKSRLDAVLADGVTMSSPTGTIEGKEAVLAGFGTSPRGHRGADRGRDEGSHQRGAGWR